MSDAPERIWVAWPSVNGCGLAFNVEADNRTRYIRATPEALAASPEGQKLVREAEARGMERALEYIAAIERLAASASIASCTCLTKTPDITFHAAGCRYVKLEYIIAQCEDFRAEAAAIRGDTE